jgi:hypothetical protein
VEWSDSSSFAPSITRELVNCIDRFSEKSGGGDGSV